MCDVSMDHPIVAAGYVIYRTKRSERELIETGTRVVNAEADERRIEWDSMRGEYFGAIIGVRAALEYTHDVIMLNTDCESLVTHINERTWPKEPYFPHALFSFLPRFEDYHVRYVHRSNNEEAHEQARVGLEIGRKIHEKAL